MSTLASPYQHHTSQSASNLVPAVSGPAKMMPPPLATGQRPAFNRMNSAAPSAASTLGKPASAGNLKLLEAQSAAAAAQRAPQPAANLLSNRPATAESSLFQMSLTLISRLERVPGMQVYLDACENDYNSLESPSSEEVKSPTASSTSLLIGNISAGNKVDPVTKLWRFLRMGSSLCALFNVLNPNNRLKAGAPSNDVKSSKRAVYDFVQGCKAELGYSDDELFTISTVFSDSTTDLIKVIKTIQLLLESVEARLHIDQLPRKTSSVDDLAPKDKRAKVVEELLQTERKYVQDLEVLVQYQTELQNLGILSADTVHFIFPNLFQLVDFQRRFAVGIEYHASLPPEEQQFGSLFVNLQEGFDVYEGYALNMKNACDIAQAEATKLAALSHIIEPQYELQCFLIKPIQRICKYPLLLRELQKFTPKDWATYEELTNGLNAVRDITEGINETQRRLENGILAKELNDRVRDWRGHNMDDFGELLHQGTFPVVKAGFEREYQLYLFENIILCCKEAAPAKKAMTLSKKPKSKRSSLVLKGRIYMAYITDLSVTRKDGYLLHISWGKDDASDTGFFDIRFRHEEVLIQWESTIRRMVARYHQHSSGELFHSYPDGDETLLNGGTSYDDLSDDEFDEFGRARFRSGSTTIDPLEAGQYPSSESASARSLSSSFVGYQYHHQQQLSESLNGLRLSGSSMRSREGSAVSLAGGGNFPGSTAVLPALSSGTYGGFNSISIPTRSRSASSPNYPSLPSLTCGTAAPPMPPMPTNIPPNGVMANRIKSESAVPSSRERSTGSQDSSSSSSGGTLLSNASFNSSTATTPLSTTGGGFSKAAVPPKNLKVKLHFLEDSFLLIVPGDIQYHQLLERVERKIRLCGKQIPSPLRIKYKDEDEDFVTINSDEDIQMALEPRLDSDNWKNNEMLTIWVAY